MDHVQCKERTSINKSIAPGTFHDFADDIQVHWDALASGDSLAHSYLLDKIKSQRYLFRHLVSTSTRNVIKRSGYTWKPVIDEKNLSVGLLHFPSYSLMPAHDHPDTIGFILVLSGSVEIIQSDLENPTISNKQHLHCGDVSLTFPIHNNIHSLECYQEPAILLSVNTRHMHSSIRPKKWHFSASILNNLRSERPNAVYAIITATMLSLAQTSIAGNCVMRQAEEEVSNNNFEKAALLLEDCAHLGHVTAQCKLADLYYSGHGVEQDFYTAAQWYRKAAEQGDTHAQYIYGVMLVEGQGVTDDPGEGFDWIFKAMMAGHTEAKQAFEYLLANPAPLDC